MPEFGAHVKKRKHEKKDHEKKRDHEHKKRDHGHDTPDGVESHHEGSAG
jgi:hypothetical protein